LTGWRWLVAQSRSSRQQQQQQQARQARRPSGARWLLLLTATPQQRAGWQWKQQTQEMQMQRLPLMP
jgi:hypothetical protein